MKPFSFLALPAVLLALAGCGSSSSSSSTAGGGSAATSSSSSATTSSAATSSSATSSKPTGGASASSAIQVTMKSLAFNPTAVTAKVGQTIQWTNDDGPPHNVTYVSGPKFTSSSTLNTGGKFSLKLTQPGTIHYICSIHPFMKATIVVTQ